DDAGGNTGDVGRRTESADAKVLPLSAQRPLAAGADGKVSAAAKAERELGPLLDASGVHGSMGSAKQCLGEWKPATQLEIGEGRGRSVNGRGGRGGPVGPGEIHTKTAARPQQIIEWARGGAAPAVVYDGKTLDDVEERVSRGHFSLGSVLGERHCGQ